MSMAVDPDITYGVLTDYENNPQIYKSVSKVDVEYKDNSKFVTQHAHWNLMFWSGTFDMKMKVEEDRSKRAVSFKLWGFALWFCELLTYKTDWRHLYITNNMNRFYRLIIWPIVTVCIQ